MSSEKTEEEKCHYQYRQTPLMSRAGGLAPYTEALESCIAEPHVQATVIVSSENMEEDIPSVKRRVYTLD